MIDLSVKSQIVTSIYKLLDIKEIQVRDLKSLKTNIIINSLIFIYQINKRPLTKEYICRSIFYLLST